jgi:ribose/xylose/arabinose/galactoside ABC-type transport system permease subunit
VGFKSKVGSQGSLSGMTAAAPTRLERRNSLARPLGSLLRSEYLVLLLSGIYFLAVLPFTPQLGSRENLANVVSSLLPLLIVGVGQTFVLISGGIDLSVTSIIALTSIAGAGVMNAETGLLRLSDWATVAGIAVILLVGGAVGAVNGVAITRFRMPPFIVTLTTMMFFSGLAIWLTHSRNIGNLPAGFNRIGAGTASALVLAVIVSSMAHIALSRSVFGRWLYAVGHNARAAMVSGVPVQRVVWSAYVVSGVCAAVASILYTGRLETGSPVLGQRILLDVIGATVIGGTSLYGGKGKVIWTVYGALFLTLLDNSLNLLNLSYFTIMMAKGAIILLAALIDTTRHRLLATLGPG